MDEFNKENLAGEPELRPGLRNYIDSKEPQVSANTHYTDDSRHIKVGERKKWNESSRQAMDYCDYKLRQTLGTLPDGTNKTFSELIQDTIVNNMTEILQKLSEAQNQSAEAIKAAQDAANSASQQTNQTVTEISQTLNNNITQETEDRNTAIANLDTALKNYTNQYCDTQISALRNELKAYVDQQIANIRSITIT